MRRRIAQAITDARAAPPEVKPFLLRRSGRWLERWVRRGGDPTVRYRIHGVDLELPFSHALPSHRRLYPHYDTALGRLAAAAAKVHPVGTILDIGANVGDSAALLRSGSAWPILCVEGEPRFHAYLERNAPRIGGLVVLERAFVGAEDGFLEARSESQRGTARIVASEDERLAVLSLGTLLAHHPELPPLRIVKVDTDGFDWPILEAALPILARHRPALFYECDARFYPAGWDPRPLWRAYREAGWRHLVAYENTGELFSIADARDEDALATLVAYLRARKGRHGYLDVCAFHEADGALARAYVDGELARFDVTRPEPAGGAFTVGTAGLR